MLSDSFGEIIKRKRSKLELPIRKIAAQIDIDLGQLSKIERSRLLAPKRIVKPLAKALDLDYKYLQTTYWSERLLIMVKNEDYAGESLMKAMQEFANSDQKNPPKDTEHDLVNIIRNYFKNHPVQKAWLFGSFARGEARVDSDIDILVRFKQPNQIDLFDYVGMQQYLESITGRKVDLVEEGQTYEQVGKRINKDKVLIYEC